MRWEDIGYGGGSRRKLVADRYRACRITNFAGSAQSIDDWNGAKSSYSGAGFIGGSGGSSAIASIMSAHRVGKSRLIDYRTYALTGKQNCGELRLTPSTVSGCERTVKALNGSV